MNLSEVGPALKLSDLTRVALLSPLPPSGLPSPLASLSVMRRLSTGAAVVAEIAVVGTTALLAPVRITLLLRSMGGLAIDTSVVPLTLSSPPRP